MTPALPRGTSSPASRVAWVVDVAAAAGCVALVVAGRATIEADPAPRVVGVTTAVVACCALAGPLLRLPAVRVAPALFCLLANGLLGAASIRTAIVGFGLAALLPAAALWALPASVPRWTVGLVGVAALAAGATRVLLRDPFRELRCDPACARNPLALTYAPAVLEWSERLVAMAALLACVLAVLRLARSRTPARGAFASLLVVVALAAWTGRMLADPRPAPDDGADRAVVILVAGALAAAGLVRAAAMADVAVTRLRVREFARSLAAAGDLGALTTKVRTVAGDPTLEIRLGAAPGDDPARGWTSVVRGSRTVATLEHAPGASERVGAAVTPALALALETQQLHAATADRLDELQRSRRTAVERSDEARRRLERDLHDGAQQRMLIVGMQLAHAAGSRDPNSDTLAAAAGEVGVALAELRRLGRGDAAIIAELGLGEAVASFAETADVVIRSTVTACDDPAHECWPATIAVAAYRVVVGAVVEAEQSGASAVEVVLTCGRDAGRVARTVHDGVAVVDRQSDRDRVFAAGGTVTESTAARAVVFDAWLP
jgi:signal transduction histidine kinase